MPRVPVLLADLLEHAAGALLVVDPGEGAPEPGPRSSSSADTVPRDRAVRRDGHGLEVTDRRAFGTIGRMRIVSLLPSTTEILFAIGAGDDVVGVTFECDHPARGTRTHHRLDERDARGSRRCRASTPTCPPRCARARTSTTSTRVPSSGLDADLVVTQDLCAVCAVDVSVVDDALAHLGCTADVLTIDPHTLDEVLASVAHPGRGHRPRGRGGRRWCASLRDRLDAGARRGRRLASGRARHRGCCCWSGPTRRSRRVTGCPEMVTLAGGVPTVGAAGREVGPGDLGAGARRAARTWSSAPPAATTSTAPPTSAHELSRLGRAAGGRPGLGGGRQRVVRAPRTSPGRRRREPRAHPRPGARTGRRRRGGADGCGG